MVGPVGQPRLFATQLRQLALQERAEALAGDIDVLSLTKHEIHRHIERVIAVALVTEAIFEHERQHSRAVRVGVFPDMAAEALVAVGFAFGERRVRKDHGAAHPGPAAAPSPGRHGAGGPDGRASPSWSRTRPPSVRWSATCCCRPSCSATTCPARRSMSARWPEPWSPAWPRSPTPTAPACGPRSTTGLAGRRRPGRAAAGPGCLGGQRDQPHAGRLRGRPGDWRRRGGAGRRGR